MNDAGAQSLSADVDGKDARQLLCGVLSHRTAVRQGEIEVSAASNSNPHSIIWGNWQSQVNHLTWSTIYTMVSRRQWTFRTVSILRSYQAWRWRMINR